MTSTSQQQPPLEKLRYNNPFTKHYQPPSQASLRRGGSGDGGDDKGGGGGGEKATAASLAAAAFGHVETQAVGYTAGSGGGARGMGAVGVVTETEREEEEEDWKEDWKEEEGDTYIRDFVNANASSNGLVGPGPTTWISHFDSTTTPSPSRAPIHEPQAQIRPPGPSPSSMPTPTARRSISGLVGHVGGPKAALPTPPRSFSSSSSSSTSTSSSSSVSISAKTPTPLSMTTTSSSSVPVFISTPPPNPSYGPTSTPAQTPTSTHAPPQTPTQALRPPTPPMGTYVLTRSTSLVTRALPTPPMSPAGGRPMVPRSGGGGSMSMSMSSRGAIGMSGIGGGGGGGDMHGRSQSVGFGGVGGQGVAVGGGGGVPPPSSFALRGKSPPLPVPPRQVPLPLQPPQPQPPQPQQTPQPQQPPQPQRYQYQPPPSTLLTVPQAQTSPMDWDSASSISFSSSSSSLYTTESEESSSSSDDGRGDEREAERVNEEEEEGEREEEREQGDGWEEEDERRYEEERNGMVTPLPLPHPHPFSNESSYPPLSSYRPLSESSSTPSLTSVNERFPALSRTPTSSSRSSSSRRSVESGETERTVSRTPSPGFGHRPRLGPAYGLMTPHEPLPSPLPPKGFFSPLEFDAQSFVQSSSPVDSTMEMTEEEEDAFRQAYGSVRSESPVSSLGVGAAAGDGERASPTTTSDTHGSGSGSSVWTPHTPVPPNAPFSFSTSLESRVFGSLSSSSPSSSPAPAPQSQSQSQLVLKTQAHTQAQTQTAKKAVEPLSVQKKPMTMGEIQALLQREKEALVQGRLAGGASKGGIGGGGLEAVGKEKPTVVDPREAERRIYDAATATATATQTKAQTQTKKTFTQISSSSESSSSLGSSVSSGPSVVNGSGSGSGRLAPLRFSGLGMPTPWTAALGPTTATATTAATTGTMGTAATATKAPASTIGAGTPSRAHLPNLSLIDLDSPIDTGLPTAIFMSPPAGSGLPPPLHPAAAAAPVVPSGLPPPFSEDPPLHTSASSTPAGNGSGSGSGSAGAGTGPASPLLRSPGIDVSSVDPGLLGVLKQLEGQGFAVRAVGVGGAGVKSPPFSPPAAVGEGDAQVSGGAGGGGSGGVGGVGRVSGVSGVGGMGGPGQRVQMQRGLRGLGRVPTYDESENWAREQREPVPVTSAAPAPAVTAAPGAGGERVTSSGGDESVQSPMSGGGGGESEGMATTTATTTTSLVPNEPTITHPSPNPRPGRSQVETSIAEVWFLKTIRFKGKEYRIVTQNYNGPCSFIAICNILILREQIRVEPATRTSVSYEFLSMLVADYLISSSSSSSSNGETLSVDEALTLLPLTQKGLDLSPIFTSHTSFKPSPALRLFQLCDIELVHGWVVDPGSGDEAEVLEKVGDYDTAVGLVVEVDHLTDGRFLSGLGGLEGGPGGLEEDEEVVRKVKEAITIQTFLSTYPTQLTYWGLFTLATECKGKGFQALFRNEHLSVVYDGIYCLVTDDGYLEEGVIWERMEDVDRGVFVGDFTAYPNPRAGAGGGGGAAGGSGGAGPPGNGAAGNGGGKRVTFGGSKAPKVKSKDKPKDKDCVIC